MTDVRSHHALENFVRQSLLDVQLCQASRKEWTELLLRQHHGAAHVKGRWHLLVATKNTHDGTMRNVENKVSLSPCAVVAAASAPTHLRLQVLKRVDAGCDARLERAPVLQGQALGGIDVNVGQQAQALEPVPALLVQQPLGLWETDARQERYKG